MTIQEIFDHFKSEWVLLSDYDTDENNKVIGGKVEFHHPNKDTVYSKMMELKLKKFTVIFAGELPKIEMLI